MSSNINGKPQNIDLQTDFSYETSRSGRQSNLKSNTSKSSSIDHNCGIGLPSEATQEVRGFNSDILTSDQNYIKSMKKMPKLMAEQTNKTSCLNESHNTKSMKHTPVHLESNISEELSTKNRNKTLLKQSKGNERPTEINNDINHLKIKREKDTVQSDICEDIDNMHFKRMLRNKYYHYRKLSKNESDLLMRNYSEKFEKPLAFTLETLYEFSKPQISILKESYVRADLDKDGRWNISELKYWLETHGSPVPHRELRCIMKDMDVNGDGMIDFDEFISFCRKLGLHELIPRRVVPGNIFLDCHGEGKFESLAEIKQCSKQQGSYVDLKYDINRSVVFFEEQTYKTPSWKDQEEEYRARMIEIYGKVAKCEELDISHVYKTVQDHLSSEYQSKGTRGTCMHPSPETITEKGKEISRVQYSHPRNIRLKQETTSKYVDIIQSSASMSKRFIESDISDGETSKGASRRNAIDLQVFSTDKETVPNEVSDPHLNLHRAEIMKLHKSVHQNLEKRKNDKTADDKISDQKIEQQ